MRRKYGYWLLTVLIVGVSCFAGYEYNRAHTLENSVSNTYNRALFELSDYVDDINSLLAKGLLVNSPEHFASISAELSRQSAAAKECLSQLPVSEISLDKTEKFLSQVGDYSFYLSQNALYDTKMTDEEYQTFSTLGTYAESLSAALNSIQQDIYSGAVTLGKSSTPSETTAYADGDDGFSAIEKEFGEYPSLIYDGPFSEHIESRTPAMLDGKEEISAEEAAIIANNFFGKNTGFISYGGKSENSAINCFTFSANDNTKTVSITTTGGQILYYMDNRDIGEATLDVNEATAKAQEFLTAHGYNSMTESYYEKTDGSATINFAYQENDVVHYSDLIKVKVALDNGEVIGLETNGYIMNHTLRGSLIPKLTRQEARNYVSKHLDIDSARLALIPKDSKREVLCYEFHGTSNGKNFLIYINAQNGREEEIALLIESENGILTV
ncbi:MAG: germination protein YpeB [Eubacteriales bacterium]|nr:germination protein YpeB [Eubacteriales bacterium]